MRNDHSWRGMIIKDNEGDWGLCVAAWRGMKKGRPGIPGKYAKSQTFCEKFRESIFFSLFSRKI